MLNVAVILGSTRPNRVSEPVGKWLFERVKRMEGWNAELVDLRDWPLPFYQEVSSVMSLKGAYSIPLAAEWAKKVGSFDAFLVVTPEYNHGTSAVLKNALDYVYFEWNRKPMAFAAYGSAGGARAVEQLRQTCSELQVADITEALHLMRVSTLIADGVFHPEPFHEKKTDAMLAQLDWWGKALKTARDSGK